MQAIRHYLASLITVFLCSAILFVVFVLNIDLFDVGVEALTRMESGKLDDIVSVCILLIIGLLVNLYLTRQREKRQREKHQSEIEAHRLRVLKATMRTVQDLVNNFLNNMQLFRLEAEDGPLSPESLQLLDDLIFETAEKLTALGDSEDVHETQMASGTGIRIQLRQLAN
jgi:ABC-type transport system involved in Fe-S cluster assembly fused permease/ATPase subunit